MTDHLVVSPHADDAVWSSGGRIARWILAGDRVTVLTVFNGDGPASTRPDWVTPAPDRRAEDDEAMRLLAARLVSGDVPEAAMRTADGIRLYSNPLRLFGDRAPADSALVDEVRDLIADHLVRDAVLHAPLGIGGHVDHLIVSDAVASLTTPAGRLHWYEDFPYRQRGDRSPTAGLAAAFSEVDLPGWLAAAACYRTQARVMFGCTARLLEAITARAAAHGRDAGLPYAERVWGRVGAEG